MKLRWISDVLKEMYGEKIYRLALSSGCSCPNRDGTVGVGGCTFCSEGGSGEFAAEPAPVAEQIVRAKALVRAKTDGKRFIAYFQSFTNTYGDVERLRKLYTETILRDDIVILSIGTRPDCLGDEVLEMLAELNRIKPVWVELGLQTANDATAQRVNRGYPRSVFEDAYRRLREAGISVVVHLIFGLPGESREDMLASVSYIAGLTPPPDGVKLQLLQVLAGTKLAEEYRECFAREDNASEDSRDNAPALHIMSLQEYGDLLVDALRLLPPETVVHRITGDGPKRLLLAPKWCADKKKVLNYLTKRIREELF
ncbi:MAG: TIGR01212 family radical SAM protein [Lachnospiraceae bacterium]|nr:TIGR01212 family radical SAM protein [Lachnospiraceae bacterium]